MSGSIRIARILGIEVKVHFSWILIFGLVLFTLSEQVFPEQYPFWSDEKTLLIAAIAALLFFASVVAHEFAHAIVARVYRMEVSSITLFLLGGVANLTKEPTSARGEFFMAFAGPATSFVIGGIGLGVSNFATTPTLQPVEAVAGYLGAVNVALGIFNLIPGFPLDGGRVLRSIIWGIRKDRAQATRIAARGGQVVAGLLVASGIILMFTERDTFGAWYFVIAYFLYTAASSSLAQERAAAALRGARVAEVMTANPESVTPDMVIGSLVRDVVLHNDVQAVPVVAEGRFLGLVLVDDLRHVDHEKWPVTPVSDVMRTAADLPTLAVNDPLLHALELFGTMDVQALPVLDGGAVVGVVVRDSLVRHIQMREALGAGSR